MNSLAVLGRVAFLGAALQPAPLAQAAPPAHADSSVERLFARSLMGIQYSGVPGARRLFCPLPADRWPGSAVLWVDGGQWVDVNGRYPRGAEILDQTLLALVPPGVTEGRFIVPEVGTIFVTWPDGGAGELVMCTDARQAHAAWTVLGTVEPWVPGQEVRLSGTCRGLGEVDEEGSFVLSVHEDACALRVSLITDRGEVAGPLIPIHRPLRGDLVLRLPVAPAVGE